MSASASMVLVTSPTGGEFYNSPPPEYEGFTFTTAAVLTDPTVTQLGIYDWGKAGLSGSHLVTLFDAGGVALTSVTIASGGGADANGWKWASTTPVNLAPSTTYTLGAFYGDNDPDHFIFGSGTLPAGFTLNNAVYSDGTEAPAHVWGGAGQGFFGPNLSAVPEPTTVIAGALLLLPFGASTLRMLRKNRTA
jgi:hypothetical protein